jgi:hypothetical protein
MIEVDLLQLANVPRLHDFKVFVSDIPDRFPEGDAGSSRRDDYASRVFHPPGTALAMCPALLHLGPSFAPEVVLPFTLVAVISWAVISRLLRGLPGYPMTPLIGTG